MIKGKIVLSIAAISIIVTWLTSWFTAFLLNAAFFAFYQAYRAELSGKIGTESGTVKKSESPIVFRSISILTVMMGIMLLHYAGVDALKDANIAENNTEIRSRIKTAIDIKNVQARGVKQDLLWYASKEQTPYTGWVKQRWANGQIRLLTECKEGKVMTAFAWRIGGENCPHTSLVNGKGVVVDYNEDGTEKARRTYKDGTVVED